jgi:hypothetical protein
VYTRSTRLISISEFDIRDLSVLRHVGNAETSHERIDEGVDDDGIHRDHVVASQRIQPSDLEEGRVPSEPLGELPELLQLDSPQGNPHGESEALREGHLERRSEPIEDEVQHRETTTYETIVTPKRVSKIDRPGSCDGG